MKLAAIRTWQEVTTPCLFETNIRSLVPKTGLAVPEERKPVTSFAAQTTQATIECDDAEISVTELPYRYLKSEKFATDYRIGGILDLIFGTNLRSVLTRSAGVLTFADGQLT